MKIVGPKSRVGVLRDIEPGSCCLLRIGPHHEVAMRIRLVRTDLSCDGAAVWFVVLSDGIARDFRDRGDERVEPVEVAAAVTRVLGP